MSRDSLTRGHSPAAALGRSCDRRVCHTRGSTQVRRTVQVCRSTVRLGAAEPDTAVLNGTPLFSFLVAFRKRGGAVAHLTRILQHSMISDHLIAKSVREGLSQPRSQPGLGRFRRVCSIRRRGCWRRWRMVSKWSCFRIPRRNARSRPTTSSGSRLMKDDA